MESLVDEFLANRHPLVHYRTYEDHDRAQNSKRDLSSLSPEELDRAYFEQAVRLLLVFGDEAMSPSVKSAYDTLWDAFYRSLDLCAMNSQYPDARLYEYEDGGYYPVWSPEDESDRLGMTLEQYLDFRHECNKFAASYPALDDEHRDELLKTRRDYYLEILRSWMRDHPEIVVPLMPDQNSNQPYQDYVREACQAAEDPEDCIRYEGVSLP